MVSISRNRKHGVGKGWERQAKLNLVEEDLMIAKEQMSLIQKEKAEAIDELKEAQKAAEEANKKLGEALVAQKRAEESLKIEKFRTVELEQAGIEDAKKKGHEDFLSFLLSMRVEGI
ncbi:hypothetical protein V6Z11_D13G209300 [Gossypium hirsutum]|nr:hypothetical protein ES288_D13G215500v1 [Gossypium darwinii]TYH35775.1 hypothetical protein ES332_D13G216400v1 [Gossypium tomentosum]